MALKITALTSVGLGGWYAGQLFEKWKHVQKDRDCQTSLLSEFSIERMPGLPIFGTVSAATPIGSNNNDSHLTSLSTSTSRTSQIMRFGFPGLDHVRSYDDFVLSYDRRNRIAHWVFEHLSKDNVKSNGDVDRSQCEFKPDKTIHPFFRSDNKDYKYSGYDRGHLAAAGNHKAHQKHIEQTFFLSNIAPQVGVGFNRDAWNKLEKYVRKMTEIYTDVYVCTGPLFLPKKEVDGKKYIKYEVIGTNHVAVPTHFYKVIVGQTKDCRLEMEAFVMPNAPIDSTAPLANFQVPPESVERAAGLLFFDKISRDKLSKINGKRVGWT
ncbi:endonuclease G, mitochondrial [Neodiprion pinetum]|uniref:endonuclease G, mitochondrial n=1 Tax=Neodiprion fabricii TaxID=2872261 RepID=UPI001ED93816|nr:endonuclease G, mitochondrial [Neodiprion fabricii]XP_046474740.1 endonuclease G, mitochondrial [Neodiprion pinetum]